MSDPVETITCNDVTLAVIVRAEFREPGIHFFTPGEFSQQLAFMRRPPGWAIEPHVHNPVRREVHQTQEVLLLRRGRLRVDFYDPDRTYVTSRILAAGDVILLADGGHGFEMLDEVEMVEVKQGPYAGDDDKTRFPPVSAERIAAPRQGQ